MMLVEHTQYLTIGGIVVLLVTLLFVGYRAWQKHTLKKAQPDEKLRDLMLERLAPLRSNKNGLLKRVLVLLAIYLAFIGLANPKIGTQLGTVKREGVDLVFAIDVSKSMLTEDIAPNRIEKAKRIVAETLSELKGDRVGIITYAASAFPQLPITTDYGAARMFLKGVNTDMMSSQGTAILEAVKLAGTFFDPNAETRRVLVLLSDGEDHNETGVDIIAETANQANIQIITVATGTTSGGPIPEGGIAKGSFKKDSEGNVVISKLNKDVLEELADSTNGVYIDTPTTEATISTISDFLAQLDKTAFETQTYSNYKDQFQWFIAIAFVILVIEFLIPERKLQWFKK
ncbi:MAG: VWA domain-containing protein [Flavobacteriaceae bacterium]|jgi:Ca-activated chloride channel family protein